MNECLKPYLKSGEKPEQFIDRLKATHQINTVTQALFINPQTLLLWANLNNAGKPSKPETVVPHREKGGSTNKPSSLETILVDDRFIFFKLQQRFFQRFGRLPDIRDLTGFGRIELSELMGGQKKYEEADTILSALKTLVRINPTVEKPPEKPVKKIKKRETVRQSLFETHSLKDEQGNPRETLPQTLIRLKGDKSLAETARSLGIKEAAFYVLWKKAGLPKLSRPPREKKIVIKLTPEEKLLKRRAKVIKKLSDVIGDDPTMWIKEQFKKGETITSLARLTDISPLIFSKYLKILEIEKPPRQKKIVKKRKTIQEILYETHSLKNEKGQPTETWPETLTRLKGEEALQETAGRLGVNGKTLSKLWKKAGLPRPPWKKKILIKLTPEEKLFKRRAEVIIKLSPVFGDYPKVEIRRRLKAGETITSLVNLSKESYTQFLRDLKILEIEKPQLRKKSPEKRQLTSRQKLLKRRAYITKELVSLKVFGDNPKIEIKRLFKVGKTPKDLILLSGLTPAKFSYDLKALGIEKPKLPKKTPEHRQLTPRQRLAKRRAEVINKLKNRSVFGNNPRTDIIRRLAAGETNASMAKLIGVSQPTFGDYLKVLKIKRPRRSKKTPEHKIILRGFRAKKHIYLQAKEKGLLEKLNSNQRQILQLVFDQDLTILQATQQLMLLQGKKILPTSVRTSGNGAIEKLEKLLTVPKTEKPIVKFDRRRFLRWRKSLASPLKELFEMDDIRLKEKLGSRAAVKAVRKTLFEFGIISPNSDVVCEIDILDFPPHLRQALVRAGIREIGQLCGKKESELMSIKGVHSGSIYLIKDRLMRLINELDHWE